MKAIGVDISTTTISAVVMDSKTKNVIESRIVPNGSFIEVNDDWECTCEKAFFLVLSLTYEDGNS
ncbi:hypothetical protein [Muricomes intestini]|jgi:sugar (pentulose or hexulose) kinase|uniref:hypothetical protein n=1 Tax=Muricomes intestini TaxID=1796634 RepID=UPI002FE02DE2